MIGCDEISKISKTVGIFDILSGGWLLGDSFEVGRGMDVGTFFIPLILL